MLSLRHKITAPLLIALVLFFTHSCNNGLNGLLELQRVMIPVTTQTEFENALLVDGAVIGIMNDIELSKTFTISGNKTITITPFEQDVKLIRGLTPTDDALFTVDNSAIIFGDKRCKKTLFLEGTSTITEALVTIKNNAHCIMNDGVVFRGNNANGNFGGAVRVISGSCFEMKGGRIAGNSANAGGGVYVVNGTFTMTGGIITGNKASSGGGVFIGSGNFTLSGNARIIGNDTVTFSTEGGGVNVSNGTFTMNGGEISSNSTLARGGGVSIYNSTFTMNGGLIINNFAAESGGGVYVDSSGSIDGSGLSGIWGNNPDQIYPNNIPYSYLFINHFYLPKPFLDLP